MIELLEMQLRQYIDRSVLVRTRQIPTLQWHFAARGTRGDERGKSAQMYLTEPATLCVIHWSPGAPDVLDVQALHLVLEYCCTRREHHQ